MTINQLYEKFIRLGKITVLSGDASPLIDMIKNNGIGYAIINEAQLTSFSTVHITRVS